MFFISCGVLCVGIDLCLQEKCSLFVLGVEKKVSLSIVINSGSMFLSILCGQVLKSNLVMFASVVW